MKTYKKVKFKSREEWLKNGRKFGGSSAAAIIGVSHWNKKIDIAKYSYRNIPFSGS